MKYTYTPKTNKFSHTINQNYYKCKATDETYKKKVSDIKKLNDEMNRREQENYHL